MRTSETTGNLNKALATAQSKLHDPPAKGLNPHFKSRFARLQDALPLIRRELGAVSVSMTQGIAPTERGAVLVTRLAHESGEWLEADYPIQLHNDPQKQGSAMTYARRYSLFALLGLAADEDDDGNSAAKGVDHHPSFKKNQARFCAKLKQLGTDYEAVAAWTEGNGWGRPSTWDSENRAKLLHDIETDAAVRQALGL